ncbi:MAG: 4a-hydroxytetrahydrobiopterin dehydratase, partial [Methanobacterium sp.]
MKLELPELLSDEEILNKFKSLNNWKLIQMHHLRGVFKFKDFKEALNFVIK